MTNYQLQSDYKEIAGVCSGVLAELSDVLSPAKRDELHIGLSEALNNVIEHSYQEEPGNKIDVCLESSANKVTIRIIDYGRGMAEEKFENRAAEVVFDQEDMASFPEGGMGISLIKACMDATAYTRKDGANTLELVKHR